MPLRQLRRVRWAVRTCLVLGVAASVAANILHADDNPIAQAIAAWPPLALLLTVELISRVPVHRRSLAVVRLGATGAIAGIAAWVSYWHMAGVAARYGESGAAPYLLPLSVDGLVIVASVSLVELAGRIRTALGEADPATRAVPVAPAPTVGPAAVPARHAVVAVRHAAVAVEHGAMRTAEPVTVSAGEPGSQVKPIGAGEPEPPVESPLLVEPEPLVESPSLVEPEPPVESPSLVEPEPLVELKPTATEPPPPPLGPAFAERLAAGRSRTSNKPPARTAAATSRTPASARVTARSAPSHAARRGRPVTETRRLAAELAAQQPHATPDELAAQLGITTKRLRAVLAAR